MLSTEQLNDLWLELSSSAQMTEQLRSDVERLFAIDSYQTWHQSCPREPYRSQDRFETLSKLGLVRDANLQVKVNRIGERYFLTDGAWVSHLFRVFPDPDEALVLIDYLESEKLNEWADWVVDPAAGSGHTPLGYRGHARRVSCDVNVRALLYASINGALNGMTTETFFPVLNNMRMGLPSALAPRGNILFLANVPFAPAPGKGLLALNAAGGETGADLQVASFQLVKRFVENNRDPVRACFLTWTVGSLDRDEWEVPSLCREIFTNAKIKWTLIDDDYDSPELPNPAGLRESLMSMAASQYAIGEEREKRMKEYAALADSLEARGFTHMSYGMLDCDLTA